MTGPDPTPDEFRLIADLFAPLSRGCAGAMNLTDDAAVLAAEPGFDLVLTKDAMVAGVHFLADDPPDLIARKLIRVNLSDLAAKGAEPRHILLAIAIPHGTPGAWLRSFAQGLAEDVAAFGLSLIGGDTVSTPGPLTLSLTALGRVPMGRAIRRKGAMVGDEIWVSGTIGDGALGLLAVTHRLTGLDAEAQAYLAGRYRLPEPPVALGPRLIGLARAGMDISDGLVQDLGHLCRASGVGACIDTGRLPLSAAAAAALAADKSLLATICAGGDDYQLLVTAPIKAHDALAALGLSRIGTIGKGAGVTVQDEAGRALELALVGWRHFRD
jgi:thiamine-monophosphate kinase